MDTDRNLLFCLLALQADLIDARQFVEACTEWIDCKDSPLVDLLVQRGWLLEEDKAHLEYLLKRKLRKDGGDAKIGIAAAPDDIKHSLAALNDPGIQQSLAGLPSRDESASEETAIFRAVDSDERYELSGLHATGGIGRIWMAHDKVLGRRVALKELRPERASNANLSTRFLQEARITGQLEHPGVVPVYELAQWPHNREPFYTMRFVHGRTLARAARDYHERRTSEPEETFELITLLNAFVTVCKTIAFSHSRGIIHRDLKGQNVVLGDYGEVVVLDWGLAKQLTDADVEEGGTIVSSDIELTNSSLTLDGEAVGTPAYMAPEQAAGQIDLIDQQTDVYGLGAILYEILTGEPPFSGSDTKEVLRKVQHQNPVPPRQLNDEVPDLLEATCLKALAKEPSDRHASASELAEEVEQWQEVQRRKADQALRDSEALYRSLVDILPLGLVRKDLENRFTFANSRACKSFGRPREDVLGKSDFDFFPPDLAQEYHQSDRSVLETGKTLESSPFLYFDAGEERYGQSIRTPIYDSLGKIVGTQTVLWDVTELKRAEQALNDSEALYRSLVDHLPIHVLRKDLEGRFTFGNQAMCDLIGVTHDELVGKTDYDVCPPELAEKYGRDDKGVAATGNVFHTFEENRAQGRLRRFEVWKVPIRSATNEIVGIQVVFWDVTEQKQLEEELKKVTAQSLETQRRLRELEDTKPDRE